MLIRASRSGRRAALRAALKGAPKSGFLHVHKDSWPVWEKNNPDKVKVLAAFIKAAEAKEKAKKEARKRPRPTPRRVPRRR